MMFNDGSVSNNVRYQDLCVERFAINVAYNHDPTFFEIENNSMVDLRKKYGYLGLGAGTYGYTRWRSSESSSERLCKA